MNSDQQKQLEGDNAAQKELKYIKDYIASMLYEVTDNGVNMETSVDPGRPNEEEIEKERDDLKTRMKELEEVSSSAGHRGGAELTNKKEFSDS
ncbi:unnamed protein product [Pleuronectes platessa]|uniref:Uncharacterized protein n=1 Tax=Pleuronectes platessa TaxID=8262 RepID=A0A9N7TQG6_PLEPL|nr:unnamed protein product [Pleuronectes platessa]